MLRKPQKTEQREQLDQLHKVRQTSRFKIEKLEERIAPKCWERRGNNVGITPRAAFRDCP